MHENCSALVAKNKHINICIKYLLLTFKLLIYSWEIKQNSSHKGERPSFTSKKFPFSVTESKEKLTGSLVGLIFLLVRSMVQCPQRSFLNLCPKDVFLPIMKVHTSMTYLSSGVGSWSWIDLSGAQTLEMRSLQLV